jgi:hypothetical protein
MSRFNFTGIANKLVIELTELGIKCYIYHTATTGSIYIRFEDIRIGSIRLGDHDGKEKLKYKFNIRSDISRKHKRWLKDGDVWRFYLRQDDWRQIIPVLQDRFKTVQTWPASKYEYFTPSFKQQEIKDSIEIEAAIENH